MIKRTLIFLISFLDLVFGQPFLVWFKSYDSGYNDYAQGIATDALGNIIVTGTSYNGTDFDCLTIKYNPAGDTIWTRRFDTGASDIAQDVAVDDMDNIIIVGSSRLDSIYDYLVIKLDSAGNLLWLRRYQTSYNNLGMAVAIDTNQDIVVTGYSYNGNSYDYLTIKYSLSGDTIWTRRYDRGFNDLARDVVIDSDNNIIVTGASFKDTTFTYFTVKYNSFGDTLWTRQLLSPYYDDNHAYGVAADLNNNVVVVGTIRRRSRIVKYSPSGDTLWTRSYPKIIWGEVHARGVATDSLNNIFVVFSSNSNLEERYDYWTVKFTPDGDSVWRVVFREGIDTLDAFAGGITMDLWGNIIITGCEHNGSDFDYVTVKYSESGFVEEIDAEQKVRANLMVYPNPFRNKLEIRYEIPDMGYGSLDNKSHISYPTSQIPGSLKAYDVSGRLVRDFPRLMVYGEQSTILWFGDDDAGRNLPSGVYFVQLEYDEYKVIEKAILLR